MKWSFQKMPIRSLQRGLLCLFGGHPVQPGSTNYASGQKTTEITKNRKGGYEYG
ncbi:MAG TPA: hypothetical protein VEM15_17675 [Thermodesulfobacteriota bacterium]|nr:hypothetical protein [Thermodesulfobacteriota bacterium]